jgi:spore coat polysaccharide biosynthesis protein SpsF
MSSTKSKELLEWEGEFGDAYTDRCMPNEADIEKRMQFWANVFNSSISIPVVGEHPKSILEVGCNVGANLIAIDNLYKMHDKPIQLYGIEPNSKARKILSTQNIRQLKMIEGSASNIAAPDGIADVVITCGVLIHINPSDLEKVMGEIYRSTTKYIICAEYFSPVTREIRYRDREGLLWTNDFGSKWLDNFPLMCCGYGFAWKRISGMDNLTWWVFQ